MNGCQHRFTLSDVGEVSMIRNLNDLITINQEEQGKLEMTGTSYASFGLILEKMDTGQQ
jgi:hypothetical protein